MDLARFTVAAGGSPSGTGGGAASGSPRVPCDVGRYSLEHRLAIQAWLERLGSAARAARNPEQGGRAQHECDRASGASGDRCIVLVFARALVRVSGRSDGKTAGTVVRSA